MRSWERFKYILCSAAPRHLLSRLLSSSDRQVAARMSGLPSWTHSVRSGAGTHHRFVSSARRRFMTTTILNHLFWPSIFARMVLGASLSASGRLGVQRHNARFICQPGPSHRPLIGPVELQLMSRQAPPPKRECLPHPSPSVYPPNQCQ
jgi:hypothetical protein